MKRLLFLVCLMTSGAWAQDGGHDAETLLMEGTQFFDQANQAAGADPEAAKALYDKAIMRFERLAGEFHVENGRLFYNLGNAYLMKGELGRAILNYRRAARFIPNDANLHQNLDYARSQCPDRIEEPQQRKVLKTLFFWHYDLPGTLRMTLFALCNAVFWSVAAVALFKRKRGLYRVAAVLAVFTLSFAGSVLADTVTWSHDQTAVVLSNEVIARKGNGENYGPSFEKPLHAGVEFNVLEARSGWYHAQLFDGRECWIPDNAAERVRQGAS